MSRSPIRQVNHDRVLEVLRRGAATRRELGERAALSRSTVSEVLRDLLASGTVEFAPPAEVLPGRQAAPGGYARGRRAQRIRLAVGLGLVGGLDYGHAHVRAAVAVPSGDIVAESEVVRMDTNASPREALDAGCELLAGLLAGCRGAPLLAVGVGLPSPVDPGTGIISENMILPNWADTDPGADLARRLGVSVWVENDANLGAIAELHAGRRAPRNIIFIKVSSGIGAGLGLDGRVYRGTWGTAGEIGHVRVGSEQNLCRCGSRGCLETVVSLPRLVAELRGVHPGLASAAEMFALVRRRDAAALRVVGDAGMLIGATLAGIASVLAPDVIVIGGDIADAGLPFIDALERGVRQNTQAMVADALTVRLSTFGARSELVGAVNLAAEHTRLGQRSVDSPGSLG